MKISLLINALKEHQAKLGDVEVRVLEPDKLSQNGEMIPVELRIAEWDDKSRVSLLFVDEETGEAGMVSTSDPKGEK